MAADLLRFISLLAPAKAVAGAFWEPKAWHTVWNGRAWLNARWLTPSAAEDWHIVQMEAMGATQPLGNIQLWKWTGSKWEKV